MNQLFYGDNLDVLRRYIADESVDLVYLDPPFNSNADYNMLFKEHDGSRAVAQSHVFEDTWRWDDSSAEAYEEVVEAGGRVSRALQAFRSYLGETDMLAYLAMMAPRLTELQRALKPSGSLYLHCDPNASHYLKMLLDAVFGPACFRNEIVWKRTPFSGSSKSRARQFPRSHDIILYYTKGLEPYFVLRLLDYDEKYFKRFRNPDNDPRGPYQSVLLKTYSDATFQRLKAEDRLIAPKSDNARWRYKQFLTDLKGRPLDDIWTDINMLNPAAKERLGYPTQKPEALLDRIIEASTRPGDIVLDPFCGCGTAIASAERLQRSWLGIDITHVAINLIKGRLEDAYGPDISDAYTVIGEPTSLPDAQQLAAEDPYQFQWWALGLVAARPRDQKKGADRGIDGRLYFHDEGAGGKTKQIVISVKAGKTSVPHVRDLVGVLSREKAEIGVLVSLQEPTSAMRREAASAGYYTSSWGKHARVQLLTIEELLNGRRIDYPRTAGSNVTFRRAPAYRRKKAEQLELEGTPARLRARTASAPLKVAARREEAATPADPPSGSPKKRPRRKKKV
jgi:site-specific DNA-methyltransferase (adenine-specific)